MPGEKFLKQTNGGLVETIATQTGGAPNADKIPALDANGRLDSSMMPTGVGLDTAVIQASEALVAGDFVNIHNVTGSARVRKADAAVSGKEAHGFVLAGVASGGNATVYFEGTNTGVTGQTPGVAFLSTTAGLAQAAAPTVAAQVVQRIGLAVSPTAVNFEPSLPILLA